MNIKNVKIKNFKGIKIVDVSMDKNMIVISGPNGAGKSSFCDAIMTALAGKDKAITRPIRDGESKASIEVELDGYVVRKYFSQSKNPTLSVTPTGKMEGMRSPQAWLNAHIGNLKFDPSEFAKLKESDQRDLLMKLAGLNLSDEDSKIKDIYDERTMTGRELENMSMPSDEEIESAKKYEGQAEVSVVDLSEKHRIENAKSLEWSRMMGRFKEIDKEIALLTDEKKDIVKRGEEEYQNLLNNDELEELTLKILNAEEDNKNIRDKKLIIKALKEYNIKKENYDKMTKELQLSRDTKQQLIEAAKYPIKGLSVSDSGVLYNNIPFGQISDSQKIIIGTLIALALAPEDNAIKIVFIKLGSLLDDKALAYLEKISVEQDAQIVVEFVGDNKKGFKIVEGEVVK